METQADTPAAAAASPRSPGDAPEVSESFMGLFGAMDKLKDSMGVGAEQAAEVAQVEQHLADLQSENEKLHRYAEEAISEARRLRAENDDLLADLNQFRLVDMVAEAQQLTQVVYEYDERVVEARVAAAEAVLAEVKELRERVAELEGDNAGLSQTLNEFRQNQQQLQRLQRLEQGGAGGAADAEGGADNGGPVAHPSPSPRGTPQSSPSRVFAVAGASTPSSAQSAGKTPPGSATSNDPLAVADALAAVAGAAEGGVAVAAARMLRSHAATQRALEVERGEVERLRVEVAELTDTMTAKTFKAPSAWAEREVKYKQDKRRWEEGQKEAEAALAAARGELEALRGSSGAAALERRIQDLEARLVESERERATLGAAMHELQLSSRPQAGEFSGSGVKPYSRRRMGEGEVLQAVGQIESSAGSPHRVSQSCSPMAASSDVVHRLETVQRENLLLRSQLEQASRTSKGAAAALETPEWPAQHQPRDLASAAKTKGLQEQLARTEGEKSAIKAELQELAAASARDPSPLAPQPITLQIRLEEAVSRQDQIRTEVALLQRGSDGDTARALAELHTRLQEAMKGEAAVAAQLTASEERAAGLRAELEGAAAVSMSINVAEGEAQPVQLKVAVDGGEAAARLQAQLAQYQRQQAELQAAMQAAAARVRLPDEPTAAPQQVISLPIHVAEAIAAAAPPAAAPAAAAADDPGTAGRIEELQAELAEERSKADALREQLLQAPSAERIVVPLTIAAAAAPTAAAPQVAGREGAVRMQLVLDDPAKHQRVKELEALLEAKEEEERRLNAELQAVVAPIRLNFNIGPMGSAVQAASRPEPHPETVAITRDREEADAAWEEHQRSTDVPALTRAKVAAEARCQLLQSQVHKLQAELAAAEAETGLVQESIDTVITSGDVGVLAGLKERLRTSRASSTRRVFKRRPASDAVKPKSRAAKSPQDGAGPAGAGDAPQHAPPDGADAASASHSEGAPEELDDPEVELAALREENHMLMDHLVSSKVRLAEVEGDVLESRRSLLRAREKEAKVARELAELQSAGAPAPASPAKSPAPADRRRSLRIPGLT